MTHLGTFSRLNQLMPPFRTGIRVMGILRVAKIASVATKFVSRDSLDINDKIGQVRGVVYLSTRHGTWDRLVP